MSNVVDAAAFLDFHGVSRTVLEERIRTLVTLANGHAANHARLTRRLEDRLDNATRNAAIHPDPLVRLAADYRIQAYLTALEDALTLLGAVPSGDDG